MTTIDEDGASQVWTAVYFRHFSRYEEECESLEDAVRFLDSGEDYGELSSVEVRGPDGTVVMDEAALFEHYVKGGPLMQYATTSTPKELPAAGSAWVGSVGE